MSTFSDAVARARGWRTGAGTVLLLLAGLAAWACPASAGPPAGAGSPAALDVPRAVDRLLAGADPSQRQGELVVLSARLAGQEAQALQAVRLLGQHKHPLAGTLGADLLRRLALKRSLSGPLLDQAAALLRDEDVFVAALAEWAIAIRVGHDNDGQEVRWPRADEPAWFAAWQQAARERMLDFDYARQAIAWDLHLDAAGLLASADKVLRRVRGVQEEWIQAGAAGPAERTGKAIARLQRLRGEMEASLKARTDDPAAIRRLWLEMRRTARPAVLSRPAIDFTQVVHVRAHAPHSHRNITGSQYPWTCKPGGDICVQGLDPHAPAQPVLAGRLGPGHAHGMDLDYDAARVVFGWASQRAWPPPFDCVHGNESFRLRTSQTPTHLFEAGLDGSPPRQITDHAVWSDFEPTYLPDGRVAFASDRSGRSSECGNFNADHTVINLYACSRDGRSLRRLSDNKDIDRHPHALDDGSIVYTRWDYQERHFFEIHSLWTIRPDGTQSDALFKQHLRHPFGLRGARSIPGSGKLVAVATGHHTFAYGPVVVVDPSAGVNEAGGLRIVTPGVRPQEGGMDGTPLAGGVPDRDGIYQTPCALSETCFLAAYSYTPQPTTTAGGANSNAFAIYLIDVQGNKELLARDLLLSCTEPIPLRPRRRPGLIPPVEPAPRQTDATCYVSDVYDGVSGLERGRVRHIRISQRVGWPLDERVGAMRWIPGNAWENHFGFWSWAPVRVIGTAPVEADGSAHFRVPADTALYFQALDENHMELWRMRSHVTLQAGETRGCRGCHETQDRAPHTGPGRSVPLALARPPSLPEPPPWGDQRLLGYEWLVQPILDRHCTRCHGAKEPKAGLDFSATRAKDGFVQSFRTIFALAGGATKPDPAGVLVSTSNRFSGASVSRLTEFGSHRSRLIGALRGQRHRERVSLKAEEWLSLVTWVDANAPYYDTFFNRRPEGGGPAVRNVSITLPPAFERRP